jgi:Rifampin ADP-ribosyl transferase
VACRVLNVSRSGFYGWRDRPPSRRDLEDAYLANAVVDIHAMSRRSYGAPRVHSELRLGMSVRVGIGPGPWPVSSEPDINGVEHIHQPRRHLITVSAGDVAFAASIRSDSRVTTGGLGGCGGGSSGPLATGFGGCTKITACPGSGSLTGQRSIPDKVARPLLAARFQACGRLACAFLCPEGFQVPRPLDEGPFFHGTVADLQEGEFLTPGRRSNYRPEIVMNHIYFTALVDGAGLAAEIAAELTKGEATPRVFEVEPTGPFENDPNMTDKKFPGNPMRSYRSSAPLRILSQITDWTRQTPEQLQTWRERLSALRSADGGQIIN